jgi:addiction module HigA family antidote
MEASIDDYKGIHPGKIIERQLNKQKLSQRGLAIAIGEHPQTLGAIINGKRKLNLSLSLKIEEKLELEESLLMRLQLYYDIIQLKKETRLAPNSNNFRSILFWDTDSSKLDWQVQKKAIIERVFSRGNEIEKQEILNFYGQKVIDEILNLKQ